MKGNNNIFIFPGFLFNDDVTLNLYNIKLQGFRGKAPVQAEKSITINVLGDCSLLGSEGYFGTMTFEGSSGITVKNNLKINFMPIMSNSNTNQTKLTVTAGRLAFHFATNAPTGVTGTAGSTGTSSSKNGGNGGNGGYGGKGGNGGKGGAAIRSEAYETVATAATSLSGGAGGACGNGGSGGVAGSKGNSGFLGGSATDGNPGISRTNIYAANGVKGDDGAKIEYK